MQRMTTVDRVVEVCEWIRSGYARDLREGYGLSQAEIARDVGCSQAAIVRWEKGERRPRGNNALAYHRVLSVLAARTPDS